MFKRVFAIFVLFAEFTKVSSQNLLLTDFGFNEAKTDQQRYEVLWQTHKEALKRGTGVDYKGIADFTLTITSKTKSIPLPLYTDFAGVKITVINQSNNIYLFTLNNAFKPIEVPIKQLKKGKFSEVDELKRGIKLLVIEDKKPWVDNRCGYSYGAQRKDIILINNGRAQNSTIFPYTDGESSPIYRYCNASSEQKVVKNLIVERSPQSTYITNVVKVNGYNNVLLQNFKIFTPKSDLVADRAITIQNSTNVTLNNVEINRTYSRKDKSGYGISMNNVWNSRFIHLKAYGKWGVFGTNNMSMVTIEDSDINRFDIHCYGRDVYCQNSIFRDKYNQFSSLSGALRFIDCHFVNFVPVLFESSYSAYTHFKLDIEDCVIDVDSERPYLISAGNLEKVSDNRRKSLAKICWPDIRVRNLTVNLKDKMNNWSLFYSKGGTGVRIHGISEIDIDGLIVNGGGKYRKLYLSNNKMDFERQLKVGLRKSNIKTIEIK